MLAATATFGADKSKDGKKIKSTAVDETGKSKSEIAEKKDGILLTGSHVKQDVRRAGRITDGPSQVVVVDRQMIERSGAADLRQLIAHTGIR